MAEGYRYRSHGRRRRSGAEEYRASSDSELAQEAGGRNKPAFGDKKCYFHEGVDVDQLARYRRRRVLGQPRDHLGINGEDEDEEENLRNLVTEYRLAFRASHDDIFRSSQEISYPVRTRRHIDEKSSDDNLLDDARASYHVPLTNPNTDHNNTLTVQSRGHDDFTRIMDVGTDTFKRPAPIRRGTTLRYEGDFSSATEYSCYVPHPGAHRSELKRRGTSLRMEGDFDARTENYEKFIEWPTGSCQRPEPIILPSHLRLEGEIETSTESHDKYVPFVGARRPDILRQQTHLRLEGPSSWTPEYTDVFKEYNRIERRAPKIPESNLKPSGGFYDKTEVTECFTNPHDKEMELMAELAKDAENEEEEKKRREEEEEEEERNRLKKEEEMKLLVSKLENLKEPPLEIPEYKDAYKDFPRERPKLIKPEDEIGRADGSKVITMSPSHTRFKTKIDQDPEYKSIYLDPNKDRFGYNRPALSLRSSSRNSLIRPPSIDYNVYRRDSRRFDPPVSEIRSQYVDYGQIPRVETMRVPTNLRLEGNIDLEPEYRNAYCRDYQPPPVYQESPSRRRDRSLSASRRRDSNNYWIDNDNGDHFGAVNAAQDQDAFQVLQTKVHEESVVGKPPPGSRRNSRSSIPRSSIQSETNDRSRHRNNRSPSPSSATYRLQVSHVDDEPRGFVRRRRNSPSQNLTVQNSVNDRSPSPIRQMQERPYSPSFAREDTSKQQQAFVILDNKDHEDALPRRRRTDKNYNPNDNLSSMRGSNGNIPRPRNRTPPNWMPPWYDSSTSTI